MYIAGVVFLRKMNKGKLNIHSSLKRLYNRVEVVAPFRIGKRLSPKENVTSKMKFTNGVDHYFLKFLNINFITESNSFF
jgi:hypothetical protein